LSGQNWSFTTSSVGLSNKNPIIIAESDIFGRFITGVHWDLTWLWMVNAPWKLKFPSTVGFCGLNLAPWCHGTGCVISSLISSWVNLAGSFFGRKHGGFRCQKNGSWPGFNRQEWGSNS
jgi:hypothetical protein